MSQVQSDTNCGTDLTFQRKRRNWILGVFLWKNYHLKSVWKNTYFTEISLSTSGHVKWRDVPNHVTMDKKIRSVLNKKGTLQMDRFVLLQKKKIVFNKDDCEPRPSGLGDSEKTIQTTNSFKLDMHSESTDPPPAFCYMQLYKWNNHTSWYGNITIHYSW